MVLSTVSWRRFIETILAIVLVLAAMLKANMMRTGHIYSGLPILDGVGPLILLIAAEVSMGIWLLVGGFPRAKFYCAVGCFSLFALASGYEASQGTSSCGCFGMLRVPPTITADFDICAVIALWLTRPGPRTLTYRHPFQARLTGGIASALVAAVGLYFTHQAASAPRPTDSRLANIDAGELLNRQFPLTDEISGSDQLMAGRWIVVFYHYDCDECLEAIPAYRALASNLRSNADQTHLAFVAIPPDAPQGRDPVSPSPDYLHLSLSEDHVWIATTPLVVSLRNGQVTAAAAGEEALEPPDGVVRRP